MRSIRDVILPTTVIQSEKLNDYLSLDLTIISETFQHTGSFKFRAAYNLAVSIPNDVILTASSGNFGQALAKACLLTGKTCIIVMPKTSAKVKINAVRHYKATVELIDTNVISRNEKSWELAKKIPQAYVASAYDDIFVIEGNATLGEEIAKLDLDVVIVPVGGGGLISGILEGLRKSGHKAEVLGAEPELANDASRSLQEGKIVENRQEPMTIADGARTLSLGRLNWETIKTEIKQIIEVSEKQIGEAVRMYFDFVNLKVEPTGALSLAAVMNRKEKFEGKKVGLVVSGGNVDAEVYSKILSGEL